MISTTTQDDDARWIKYDWKDSLVDTLNESKRTANRLTGILRAPKNVIAFASLRRSNRSTVPSPIDLLIVVDTSGSVSRAPLSPICNHRNQIIYTQKYIANAPELHVVICTFFWYVYAIIKLLNASEKLQIILTIKSKHLMFSFDVHNINVHVCATFKILQRCWNHRVSTRNLQHQCFRCL